MRRTLSPWTFAFIYIALLAGLGFYRHFGKEAPTVGPPERHVEGQVLTSERNPAISLKFDPAFRYIGGQRFVNNGIADAEQHFFLDAGEDKVIRRAYWVQFESYLPVTNATYSDDDDDDRTGGRRFTIQDMQFRERDWISSSRLNPEPETDSWKFREYIRAKGYKLPASHFMVVRLVHLPDPERRTEFMLVYIEDMPVEYRPENDRNGEQWRKARQQALQSAPAFLEIKKR